MTGRKINTVTDLLVDVGTTCGIYHNETLRRLRCQRVQVDEIWSFCYSKQTNIPEDFKGIPGVGDVWTWVAIDADTKLVPSWFVGGRAAEFAGAFMRDLASRLASRVQLTSDGHRAYLVPVENAFGENIDYSMLVKLYGAAHGHQQEPRHSAGDCCGTIKGAVCGYPDEQRVSTSFVERKNLTMRMSMKRFARLPNGFSRKFENHEHAIVLHYMYYNFGRIHKTLRFTPAMESAVSDQVWSLEEIAKLVD